MDYLLFLTFNESPTGHDSLQKKKIIQHGLNKLIVK